MTVVGHPKLVDLTGQVFGRWEILRLSHIGNPKGVYWFAKCICGNERVVAGTSLKKGRSLSCGCFRRERSAEKAVTHGMSKSSEYRCWTAMRRRCLNKNSMHFSYYGGRGITICKEWDTFECFIRDMGNKPQPCYSLDRINSDGNYEPMNCRWLPSAKEQSRNTRRNVNIYYKGKLRCISEVAEMNNMHARTLNKRLRLGWELERALTEPLHTQYQRFK